MHLANFWLLIYLEDNQFCKKGDLLEISAELLLSLVKQLF